MPQIMEPKVRDPCCERRSEGPRHQLQWPIFALEYISCGKASHLRQTLKRGPHVLRAIDTCLALCVFVSRARRVVSPRSARTVVISDRPSRRPGSSVVWRHHTVLPTLRHLVSPIRRRRIWQPCRRYSEPSRAGWIAPRLGSRWNRGPSSLVTRQTGAAV